MRENEIGSLIIGAAIDVHSALGPGLLESAYERCLIYELRELGLEVGVQVPLPLIYKGVQMDCGYRVDAIVEQKVVVEIKCVEEIHPVHVAQLITYLKLTECKLGYIINFNVKLLKHGIRRIALGDLS